MRFLVSCSAACALAAILPCASAQNLDLDKVSNNSARVEPLPRCEEWTGPSEGMESSEVRGQQPYECEAPQYVCGAPQCSVAEECCVPSGCGYSAPCVTAYGEFLFLRPSNASVAYATAFDGAATGAGQVPLQMGRRGVLNTGYEPGFRIGFTKGIGHCSSIGASYSHLETRETDQITDPTPYVIRSLVIHPSSTNAGTEWDYAEAQLDIDYHLADLDFRHVFIGNECANAAYVLGVRYANLEQTFRSAFTRVGTEQIDTDLSFDGGGLRLGLEGERRNCRGFMVYGRSSASFVAGEFSARYFQGNESDPEIVNTTWTNARVVTILDLEAGVGWQSRNGRLRVNAGYIFSTWLNSIRTEDWIEAIQTNTDEVLQTSLDHNVCFDGFAVRAEIRY